VQVRRNTSHAHIKTLLRVPPPPPHTHTHTHTHTKVLRFKNRTTADTCTCHGYRDLLLHVVVVLQCETRHVCELQIHFRPMFLEGQRLLSHSVFAYFRSYFASCEQTR
jgi:hypothetical protein